MAKFCEYCGAPLKDGAKFCTAQVMARECQVTEDLREFHY